MLKTLARMAIAAVVLAASAALVQAQAATPDDAKAMAEKAAALVAAEGDKAFPKISDPNGAFHQGEVYVTVLDRQGVVRATLNPKLIGVNMWESVDPDGVKFTQLPWTATEKSETAWIQYKFTNPESKKIEPKKAWVHRVGEYVVFSGVYIKE
ncbi:MAG TPA: cache domain-containing protein [Alphaproteobacteria bacterium]|nr:cache domain-containing protein [Alphaproteobacteria bacterium]